MPRFMYDIARVRAQNYPRVDHTNCGVEFEFAGHPEDESSFEAQQELKAASDLLDRHFRPFIFTNGACPGCGKQLFFDPKVLKSLREPRSMGDRLRILANVIDHHPTLIKTSGNEGACGHCGYPVRAVHEIPEIPGPPALSPFPYHPDEIVVIGVDKPLPDDILGDGKI
jgi:hypothetical protein